MSTAALPSRIESYETSNERRTQRSHTLLLAWRDLPQLRDADRFEAWLQRLLINQCYQMAGRNRRWLAHIRTLPMETAVEPDQYLAIEDREILEHAFATLSPEQRAVVVLHHHAGMPLASIASTLGVPLGTIKSRLHYATLLLRAALSEDGHDRRGGKWIA